MPFSASIYLWLLMPYHDIPPHMECGLLMSLRMIVIYAWFNCLFVTVVCRLVKKIAASCRLLAAKAIQKF